MQAVVKIGTSQYLVSPGQQFLVDLLDQTSGTLTLDQVLLLIDGSSVTVGQPTIPGVSLPATVLGPIAGTKMRVATYKAKSRTRRVLGFRPKYTRIQIGDFHAPRKSVKSSS